MNVIVCLSLHVDPVGCVHSPIDRNKPRYEQKKDEGTGEGKKTKGTNKGKNSKVMDEERKKRTGDVTERNRRRNKRRNGQRNW